MVLYLAYDQKNKTCTAPAIANELSDAYLALKQINPENISDIILHPICNIDSLLDLFLLEVNIEKILPAFLHNRSASVTPEATQTSDSASSSLIPPDDYELSN